MYARLCTQRQLISTFPDLTLSPHSFAWADSTLCAHRLCTRPAADRSLSCGTYHPSPHWTGNTPGCTGDEVHLRSGPAPTQGYPDRTPLAFCRQSIPPTSSTPV